MVTDKALSVRVGPLTLANPVGLASGTVGYGAEYEGLMDMVNSMFIMKRALRIPRQKSAGHRSLTVF